MKHRAVLFALIAGSCWSAAPAGAERVDDARVEAAIEKAKAFLWSLWDEQAGHWPERGKKGFGEGEGVAVNYGGTTALCAYAVLAAGESHQSQRMKRTLEWLRGAPLRGTYAVALRANVWGFLPKSSPYRADLEQDAKWLIVAAQPNGGYTYTPARPAPAAQRYPYDNSNSQLALLGVWSASLAGVQVPKEYWRNAEAYWLAEQREDGGWNYGRWWLPGGRSYGSMSAAGLASLFICYDAIHFEEFADATVEGEPAGITKGLDWMAKNFGPRGAGTEPKWLYYYLYGVERVGMASGYKYFGEKDWYREGVSVVLHDQRDDGSWPGNYLLRGSEGPTSPDRNVKSDVENADISTAFALLFLARGRHPILFNKLRYEGTWNSRPRDLANLCRWITSAFEKQVHWQVIDLAPPVTEWHDAPILYISGKTAPNFRQQDLQKLRTFVYQGGVILSEAVLDSQAFSESMAACYREMFPELSLEELPEDHPIYNLHFPLRKHPRLMGISNGVRLLAIHSPADLSRAYQLRADAQRPELFQLAANIYFFVSDRGSLRHRGVSHWPDAEEFKPIRTVKLAVLEHSGRWNPEPLAWQRLAILMGNRQRVKLELVGTMPIDRLRYPAAEVAAMTGTSAFKLSNSEKYFLRKFCLDGGTVVADAAGAREDFARSFEEQVLPILSDGRYEELPLLHPIYTTAGPAIQKVQYRRPLRDLLHGEGRPRLRAVTLGDRVVLVYSPIDLTAGLVGYPCWGLKGYEPESAFELVRNVILYAAGRGAGPSTQPAR